jgi:hypothetical protein
MPERWLVLPDPASPDAVGWPLAVAADAASDDAGPLAWSLATALARAESQAAGTRVRLVLVDDPPVDVRAWALVDLLTRGALDADDAAALALLGAPSAPGERIRAWDGVALLDEIDGDPAVVVEDVPVDTVTGSVERRVVVLRFPRGAPSMLRVTVSTPRPGAVPDLRAVALVLARSIDPIPQGAS